MWIVDGHGSKDISICYSISGLSLFLLIDWCAAKDDPINTKFDVQQLAEPDMHDACTLIKVKRAEIVCLKNIMKICKKGKEKKLRQNKFIDAVKLSNVQCRSFNFLLW